MKRVMMWAVVAMLLAAGGAATAAGLDFEAISKTLTNISMGVAPAMEEGAATNLPSFKIERSKVYQPEFIPPDLTVEIPEKCREAAAKTYKQGYNYFIWFDGSEPVPWTAPSQLVLIPFCYVCNGTPRPFGVTEGLFVMKENGLKDAGSGPWGRGVGPKYSLKGKTSAIVSDLFFHKRGLKGKGVVRVSLFAWNAWKGLNQPAWNDIRISNEIEVQVEFR